MSVLSTRPRPKFSAKAAKGALKNPGWRALGAQAGLKAYTPIVKRRARKRVGRVGDTARTFGDTARTYGELLVTHGPEAAQELGLVAAPQAQAHRPAGGRRGGHRRRGGVFPGARAWRHSAGKRRSAWSADGPSAGHRPRPAVGPASAWPPTIG